MSDEARSRIKKFWGNGEDLSGIESDEFIEIVNAFNADCKKYLHPTYDDMQEALTRTQNSKAKIHSELLNMHSNTTFTHDGLMNKNRHMRANCKTLKMVNIALKAELKQLKKERKA